ncbi:hypothetical protein C7S17_2196 [Burkholderia thailandensis]|nr:hypothetical protein [Burkholderia thailandensis]
MHRASRRMGVVESETGRALRRLPEKHARRGARDAAQRELL